MPDAGPVPREALEFFRAKGFSPAFDYRDVWQDEHAIAFTVAKAMQMDVLVSIRDAVDDALANGKTFEQFKKDLTPELQRRGWWGVKNMVDPKTGEKLPAKLGSPRRLKTIYRANMRSARAAGQYERAQRTKRALPYFLYQLGPSEVHREEHSKLEGTILPVDDPFWDVYYPPNGWGCKCHLRQITKREADRRGGVSETPEVEMVEWVNKRTGKTERIPEGVDPAWATNPGKARQETALKTLGQKAITAKQELSGGIIRTHLNDNGFESWLNKPKGNYPVAAMSDSSMAAIKANQRVVWLSSETVKKQLRNHPELTVDDYRIMPDLIDQGTIIRDRNRFFVFFTVQDRLYKSAIKTTETGDGNFLESLIRTSEEELNRLKNKGRILRP